MHIQAKTFTEFVKSKFPHYFDQVTVLDVGSGDINGNNQFLFSNTRYVGNDVMTAPNVTIVSKTKNLPFAPNTFDTIISTECFEHDPDFPDSIRKIYDMLKPGGLFVFTCASTGRPEHGTRRTSPNDSYGTISNQEDMVDYYKNITIDDLREICPLNSVFSFYQIYYEFDTKDLYFFGIKNGVQPRTQLYHPTYYYYGRNTVYPVETYPSII
jgi:SAM-dependent methyltransferase